MLLKDKQQQMSTEAYLFGGVGRQIGKDLRSAEPMSLRLAQVTVRSCLEEEGEEEREGRKEEGEGGGGEREL